MQNQSFELKSCAAAMYDNKGVTIWFTEKPLSAAEVEKFQLGSYADLSGTAMYMGFCPGGNTSVADPKAAQLGRGRRRARLLADAQQNFLFKPRPTRT